MKRSSRNACSHPKRSERPIRSRSPAAVSIAATTPSVAQRSSHRRSNHASAWCLSKTSVSVWRTRSSPSSAVSVST
ncbi:MAG TPA: hypothetical protein DEW31_07035 [Alistipes obesi]|nr:hypothetical protein [Alistipes communis]